MVRSDEFFNLMLELDSNFEEKEEKGVGAWKYLINQSVFSSFNFKHNLPMGRVQNMSLEQAKDIYLEFFYFKIKSIINPEIHFNHIDIFYNSGQLIYVNMCKELSSNFTIDQVYNWRLNYYNNGNISIKIEPWLERLSKIRAYFKYR